MDKNNQYRNKRAVFLMVCLTTLFFLSNASLAEDGNIEYKIKAAYLYNFTKFISWPENKSDTFNLCILGKDPFGSIIDPIEKRTVKNKPIRVYRYQSISKINRCHIVYFGKSGNQWGRSDLSLSGILTIGSLNNTLTAGESKKFTHSGGMFGFFLKQGKVKLHVNLQAIRNSGLEVSAKLLEVSEVYDGGSDG